MISDASHPLKLTFALSDLHGLAKSQIRQWPGGVRSGVHSCTVGEGPGKENERSAPGANGVGERGDAQTLVAVACKQCHDNKAYARGRRHGVAPHCGRGSGGGTMDLDPSLPFRRWRRRGGRHLRNQRRWLRPGGDVDGEEMRSRAQGW